MAWSDYWGALSARQRTGLGVGAALIVIATAGIAIWLLHDPYVPLGAGQSPERIDELAQRLETAKVDYQVREDGSGLTVRRSQLGKAHAAGAAADSAPNVGLELFKESDFSTTDFAQRINYQRALQGELTRTIETIAGVRSARVHVILPDSGLFKRNAAKATAAVSVTLQQGNALTRGQVLGIQRLVAASVPEISIEDVVVLDESGASLTRAGRQSEGELSSAQLDLKRQADQYLEGKLQRMLQELLPHATVSLSVDTTLDERQLRVTTEEPLAARSPKDPSHVAGVLVKEHQSQRGRASGLVQTDGYAADADSTDWEYEYKVGNRVEQTMQAPGSIKRISVAVALQGAPEDWPGAAVEDLVAHAVGMDRSRGDSVAVLMLPAASAPVHPERVEPGAAAGPASRSLNQSDAMAWRPTWPSVALGLLLVAALLAGLLWRAHARSLQTASGDFDEDAVVTKVRQWLHGGAGSDRA